VTGKLTPRQREQPSVNSKIKELWGMSVLSSLCLGLALLHGADFFAAIFAGLATYTGIEAIRQA